MYRPASFIETGLTALDALIERDNFITLVTVRDGAPVLSHLPVLYRRDGDRIELHGHWARPNPQAKHAGPATAIVHGPHAYVSPSWYASKAEHGRVVPTWNYSTVHVYGELVVHDDAEWLAGHVRRLSHVHESGRKRPWSVDDAPAKFIAGQLRAIVGVELVITRIEAKEKLSQNRSAADAAGVAAGLRAGGQEASAAAVERVRP